MYDLFFAKFNALVPLSESEEAMIKSFLTHKRLLKKQFLVQQGEACKYVAFVTNGLLREYSVDADGNDHIIQFAPEGWTISDLYSFSTGEPATYNVDALEDSEVVLIDKPSHDELLKNFGKYETYTRLQLTGAYFAMQKRITSIISMSIEERYKSFLALYPDIAQRIPQHMIASYMGLQPETLSRVRKKIADDK